MSPNIRVDEEVYRYLQQRAQPFVDSPNSVLRRILNLGDVGATEPAVEPKHRSRRDSTTKGTRKAARRRSASSIRARPGTILPHEAYIQPILSTLAKAGGAAPTRHVIETVGQSLDRQLTDTDRERLPSGAIRWENRVQFVRLRLVEEGLLATDAPRGVWTLTPAGRGRAEENS